MNTNLTAYEACFKKKLYWTEEAAQEEVRRAWGAHGVGIHVYECEIGNAGKHFHVGHQSARRDSIQRLRTFGSNTVLTTR